MAAPSLMDILTGRVASQPQDDAAKEALNKQMGAFDGITPPQIGPVTLDPYTWQKDYSPEQLQQGADVQYKPAEVSQAAAVNQAPSEMAGITDDPRLRDQQSASLSALKDLADTGGMNLSDKANLNRIEDQVAQQDKGRQDAIVQNMAERGAGGSGQELLARLSSSQAATNRANQNSMDVAGQAQQRALQAMMQGGQLAGQIRGQDFGEASDKAKAQDAINQFNAVNGTRNNEFNTTATNGMNQFNAGNTLSTSLSNRQTDLGVGEFNTNAANSGQKFNIEGRQGLSNANVDTGNRQTVLNDVTLPQQNFANTMGVAGAKAGVAGAGVNYWNGQSDVNRQGFSNAVGGGAKVAGNTSFVKNLGGGGAEDAAAAGAYGGMVPAYAHGGLVPGHSLVPGDSFANDKVHTLLSPGEVVIDHASLAHAPKSALPFLKKVASHSVTTLPRIAPEHLGDFLHGLNPRKSLHQDSKFSLGQDMADTPDQPNSPNLDETIAKLSALGLLSKGA